MRKLVTLGILSCGLITAALWWSVILNYHEEQEAVLAGWSRTQLALVKGAANLAVSRYADPLPRGSSSSGWGELEFGNLIKQFQPAAMSVAWVFINEKIVYSNQPDFSTQILGQDVSQVFEQQKPNGATNFSDIVQGVLKSGEGTGWFTWQIKKGSELAAWTSLQVNQEPWTLVFFTPESEILAESSLPENGQREIVGAGLLTVLFWGIFILALRLPTRNGGLSSTPVRGSTLPGEQTRKNFDHATRAGNRSQQMQASSAGEENFLAHLNHELWTPLNTITGLAYAMQSQIYGPLNEKQARSLETIRVTSQHLTGVIRNILDYSLIQAGHLKIEIKPVDANLLIDTCLAALGQAAQEKQIQLEIKRDPVVKTILADEKRLGQVIEDLLSNAIKFTPPGGKTGLQVDGEGENGQVKITIWDTGIGIAESELPRLFAPYVQLDAGLDRQQSGLGLGLSLAAKIISFHGGSIAVESQPGVGTRFQLTLPWSASNGSPGGLSIAPVELPAAGFRRLKKPIQVILIDDDPMESRTLQNSLEDNGYEVILVSKSEDVERAIYETGPALILMNLPMWGLDGLQTVRSIKRIPGMAKSAVIILAGVVVPGDQDRYLQAGVSEYLPKPLSLERLAAVLNSLPEAAAIFVE